MAQSTCSHHSVRYIIPVLIAVTILSAVTSLPVLATASQPADTLYLDEIRVIGTRIQVPDHRQPVWIQNIDPLVLRRMPHESASYHVSGNTFALVRDYGEGNMALASQRGFSPTHTRVVWEEMPLNHPMLGVFDLSLIPSGLLDGISASSGNPAAMSGSGGIGGTLSIRTRTHPDKVFLSRSAGSYGYRQTGLGSSFRSGSFEGGIRAYHQSGDYDFPFKDPDPGQDETLRRDNNRKSSTHILAHGSYRHNDWRFRSLVWLDDTSNDLPGSVFFPFPSRQDDRSARAMFQAGFDGWDRTWVTATAGWYHYELDYNDQFTDPATTSTARMFLFQPALRHVWSDAHESHLATQWATQAVTSDDYPGNEQHQNLSARWNHSWEPLRTLTLYPSLEWEWHSLFDSALNPAMGFTVSPGSDVVMLRGMAGRNRNNPTFNDLYWSPGGNPDLQPETVYSYEAGVSLAIGKRSDRAFHVENNSAASRPEQHVSAGRNGSASGQDRYGTSQPGGTLVSGITLFRHDFDDGIRWIPDDSGMFAPQNVERLRTQGVEVSVMSNQTLGLFRLDAHYILTYTDASIRRERFSGDGSVGKQMIYVPEWMHKGTLQVDFDALLWARMSIQHVGQRFTTMDHSSPLDPLGRYTRLDIDTGWDLNLGPSVVRTSLGVRNLTSKHYEILAGYPVAPRHYRVSVALSLR